MKLIAAASLVLLLGACGGGSDDTATGAGGSTKYLPTVITSEGRGTNSCAFDSRCSNNPYAPFHAFTMAAPPNGTRSNRIVRLKVHGYDLANVGLLSASGYLPIYGTFNISRDSGFA